MKIRPKKSLGQNFLKDDNILDLIVKLGEIKDINTVLEIGPGTGNLTDKIIKKNPLKLIVVEKDNELARKLRMKFKENIILINDDILKVKEEDLIYNKMIVFGNLPYNISTQILIKFIRSQILSKFIKKIIFMFQKEVADRIVAKHNSNKYGRISIISSWKMNVKKVKEISPYSFYPPPKVKSTILVFEPKKNYYNIKDCKNLEYVTQVFFNFRRKKIKKSLNILFGNYEKISKKLNIDFNKRPQNLEPITYFKLCEEYEKII